MLSIIWNYSLIPHSFPFGIYGICYVPGARYGDPYGDRYGARCGVRHGAPLFRLGPYGACYGVLTLIGGPGLKSGL